MAESAGKGFRHSRTYASELPNGLPINGEPDSITDKLNEAGEVIKRRKYGKNGRAAIDYDLVDHGESWKHPTGAHKHIFDCSGGKDPAENGGHDAGGSGSERRYYHQWGELL